MEERGGGGKEEERSCVSPTIILTASPVTLRYYDPIRRCITTVTTIVVSKILLLRGTIVNRTYGTHKNQYISLF